MAGGRSDGSHDPRGHVGYCTVHEARDLAMDRLSDRKIKEICPALAKGTREQELARTPTRLVPSGGGPRNISACARNSSQANSFLEMETHKRLLEGTVTTEGQYQSAPAMARIQQIKAVLIR